MGASAVADSMVRDLWILVATRQSSVQLAKTRHRRQPFDEFEQAVMSFAWVWTGETCGFSLQLVKARRNSPELVARDNRLTSLNKL
jgi:hypothetical protein